MTGTKGSFENLVQLIAAGFERESTAAAKLDRDWKEGGLLILSDKMKRRLGIGGDGKQFITHSKISRYTRLPDGNRTI